jgi:tetratricopeptide (TPR) repeat protein
LYRNLGGLAGAFGRIGLYLAGILIGAAAVVWGAVYVGRAIYFRVAPRTISVCVTTDAPFREQHPRWAEQINLWFGWVNEGFRPAGIQWSIRDAGDAYPEGTPGGLRQRRSLMDDLATCHGDVLLGLTAATEADSGSSLAPFHHSALLAIGERDTDYQAGGKLAGVLAALFGASTAPDTTQIDDAAVQLIRKLRFYDFSRGVDALPGSWERRAASAMTVAGKGRVKHPEAEAHRALGRSFFDARRYANAVAQFREAVAADPRDFQTRIDLAIALKSNHDSDEALAEAARAAEISPQRGAPHAIRGAIYSERRRSWEAIDEFRAATRLEPDRADNYSLLALALQMQMGRTVEAVEALTTAKRLDPARYRATEDIENLESARSRLLKVLRQAEEAARRNPTSAPAQKRLAYMQSICGRPEDALATYAKVLALDPKDGGPHVALARIRFDRGEYESAQHEVTLAQSLGTAVPGEFLIAIQGKLKKL